MKDNNKKGYAYAIDLGSTCIDAVILDLDTGQRLSERSFKNRQSLYGSDVINRILAAVDKKKLLTMKKMVCDDLRSNAKDMLEELTLLPEDIKKICICGNATMISILLEYDLESMGHAPFATKLEKSVSTSSSILFEDDYFFGAPLILSGTASAFIGGDILSGMTYIENSLLPTWHDGKTGNWMFLDLGTNGEMVVVSGGKYYATSASCGPAFEGCTRKQHVYGSNTLDAIALGCRTKNISVYGTLKEPFDKKGITISGITLTADIIREILLAKAAIRTGIDFLLAEAGLNEEDMDVVFLAGGFGFHLNLDTAYYIGLLPEKFKGKVRVIGNASLAGACSICLDDGMSEYMNAYIGENKINVLQLADKSLYQEKLISNMTLA
ncbi:MAG: ASKHA domain-containing protein [Clostridium sp.]|nr:ASKHA domain-containing protein [Clostridium sp.]MCM1398739.1 ASKHA domain-containing protein [Clostridium sp.]MCM1458629.1 ASKHA domain-containing protein [Bacteroides sp.]